MERTILHSDMNNFYASVECMLNPKLRGHPVAVAGDPEQRHGIILAKNYEAKAYGIQTGDPLWMARQKCKDVILVPPHFERYMQFSKFAKEIYAEYTDQVEPFGLDECWLDTTGSTGLFGDGKTIADEIRTRVKKELGLTVSVGVSFNKIFAKLGSDMKKPDATTVIDREHFKSQVWPLPVSDLLYVGRATTGKLRRYGIHTIGALAQTDVKYLHGIFGKIGVMLWRFACGLDNSPVSNIGAKSLIKSIGNSTTTPRDLISDEDIRITMYVLAESVAERLRECDFVCRTVQIHVRDNQLQSYERQGVLSTPSCTSSAIFEKAFELFSRNRPGLPVRSVGLRACNLSVQEIQQLSFLPDVQLEQRKERLERTVDSIRGRYGHFIIQRGIMLADKKLSALDPKNDHIIHPVGLLQ